MESGCLLGVGQPSIEPFVTFLFVVSVEFPIWRNLSNLQSEYCCHRHFNNRQRCSLLPVYKICLRLTNYVNTIQMYRERRFAVHL